MSTKHPDTGQTCLQQQLKKDTQKAFESPSITAVEKKKKQKRKRKTISKRYTLPQVNGKCLK